jgi:hypothetical protein
MTRERLYPWMRASTDRLSIAAWPTTVVPKRLDRQCVLDYFQGAEGHDLIITLPCATWYKGALKAMAKEGRGRAVLACCCSGAAYPKNKKKSTPPCQSHLDE